MTKSMTLAVAAGAALALAGCGGKTADAPVAEPTAAEPEMMAPAPTPAATDEIDPTGNPIGMGAPQAGQ